MCVAQCSELCRQCTHVNTSIKLHFSEHTTASNHGRHGLQHPSSTQTDTFTFTWFLLQHTWFQSTHPINRNFEISLIAKYSFRSILLLMYQTFLFMLLVFHLDQLLQSHQASQSSKKSYPWHQPCWKHADHQAKLVAMECERCRRSTLSIEFHNALQVPLHGHHSHLRSRSTPTNPCL